MGKPFGHLSVVREHQDAGSGLVKPSHWEYAVLATLHQVHHGLVRVWIACCCNIALGLVHHYIDFLLSLEAFSVETHVVLEQIHLGSQLGNYLAVYGNHARLDVSVGLAARAYSGIGDELVQADLLLEVVNHLPAFHSACVGSGLAANHTAYAFLVPLCELDIIAAILRLAVALLGASLTGTIVLLRR